MIYGEGPYCPFSRRATKPEVRKKHSASPHLFKADEDVHFHPTMHKINVAHSYKINKTSVAVGRRYLLRVRNVKLGCIDFCDNQYMVHVVYYH